MSQRFGEERLYYRLESPTQTPEDAGRQEETGEIWGKAPQGSDIPKVKAYRGPLPEGARGIEFATWILPDEGGHPARPEWSAHRDDVERASDFAKIPVRVTKNTQT